MCVLYECISDECVLFRVGVAVSGSSVCVLCGDDRCCPAEYDGGKEENKESDEEMEEWEEEWELKEEIEEEIEEEDAEEMPESDCGRVPGFDRDVPVISGDGGVCTALL